MAVISPSVPIMSLFGIYQSSSLLVTGIAALLALDMRERAPFAHALGVVAGQAQDLEPFGEAIVPNRSRLTASCRVEVMRL
jgi:hypothetical protein